MCRDELGGWVSKQQRWDERYAADELVWSAGPNALFADLVRGLAIASAGGQ